MTFVTLRECYTIRPDHPTWTGRFPLTELDQVGTMTHVPTIYFYENPLESFQGNVAETLKTSLSKALFHFYPLAGRLHHLPGGRFELKCNAAGVKFTEAEANAKLSDFKDFSLLLEMESLMPQVIYKDPIETIPLFLVQLTKFGCGGLSLGVSISHAVVDGQTSLHFISEWGRIARGEPLETVPFLDRKVLTMRTALLDASDSHREFDHRPLLIGETDNVEERKKKTTVAMLKLSKPRLEKLKNRVNTSEYADPAKGFTRYETIAGHVWRCACKARGHSPEQPTGLAICIDTRTRMQPPLPREYFGNAILDVMTVSTSGELISNELGLAATKIREAINKVTNKYLKSSIEHLKNQEDLTTFQDLYALGSTGGPFCGNPNVGVVSWLTLPIYGLDFGWGKEVYMGPGTHDFDDGEIMILPDQNEDGSVILATCLQVTHMEAFKKHFYGDI